MKKKEEVAPMTVDAIVAKLYEIGDAFADKLGEAKDEDARRNAQAMRELFHTFGDTIKASFDSSVKNEVSARLKELLDLNAANMAALVTQQTRIADQQAILRGAYAERDEYKRQLDALKGAVE